MKILALPVKMGDPFLLQDGNKDFNMLVDGGDGQSSICHQIQPHTNKLNVVICTHYDKDHVLGLINLFVSIINKSAPITIDELWLPDIFARLILTKRLEARGFIFSDFDDEDDHDVSVEKKDGGMEKLSKKEIDVSIARIYRIVKYAHLMSVHFGTKIRWLTLEKHIVDKEIGHNVYGINCRNSTKLIRPYTGKGYIYNLTRINKESLVFRYNKAEEQLPNVLFTADSNFDFCNGGYVKFNEGKTIVTAPHHGSPNSEHKKVYDNLGEGEYIMIRSSERHKDRPCNAFKDIPSTKRFCTRCGETGTTEQTIDIVFDGFNWKPSHLCSSCKC